MDVDCTTVGKSETAPMSVMGNGSGTHMQQNALQLGQLMKLYKKQRLGPTTHPMNPNLWWSPGISIFFKASRQFYYAAQTAAQNPQSKLWTEKRDIQRLPAGRTGRKGMNLSREYVQEGTEE